MAEREEELKSLLMKVKEESEKVGLKLNNNGNSARLYFLGLKIPADNDCSHEIYLFIYLKFFFLFVVNFVIH